MKLLTRAVAHALQSSFGPTPEKEGEILALIPYGRLGQASDIARATVWLASDDSDYMTGTTLYIDGGMTLYPGSQSGA